MLNKRFSTLEEGLSYVEGLIRAGVEMEASRVFADRIKANKNNRHLLVLGVEKKAAGICERLAPGGTWGVEIESPGTTYEKAAILGMRTVTLQLHRASAWYSKYLPYAYAMMKSEDGFNCLGIDFESVNGYYGTVYGFTAIGQGDGDIEGWHRLEDEDRELCESICSASEEISSSSLPFTAVLRVAVAFVAARRPELLAAHSDKDHWQWQHACAVLEHLKMPRPAHRKRRRAV